MTMECESLGNSLLMALLHDVFMLFGVLLMLAITLPIYAQLKRRRSQ